MKKTLIVTIVLILTTVTTVFAFRGKSGDKNATGHISDLRVSKLMCSVNGRTENGGLWLAYTVRWKDGYELDYKPVKVKGSFSKTLYYKARPQGLDEVIVCLWRYKVSAKRCAKDNGGTACQYCRKNGIHMEGRVDRRSGD